MQWLPLDPFIKDLEKREKHLANQLKLLVADMDERRTPENKEQQSDILIKMANIYTKKATFYTKWTSLSDENRDRILKQYPSTMFPLGDSIIKASALYNAARIRTQSEKKSNDIDQELFKLHNVCYTEMAPGCEQVNYETWAQQRDLNRKTLQDIRNSFKDDIFKVWQTWDVYSIDDKHDLREHKESVLHEMTKSLGETITQKMKKYIQSLIDQVISKIGKAPCIYSIIGLGSLAKGLMTLHSDFEFVSLLEEGKDNESNKSYFRKLTYLLNLYMIDLSETHLHSMPIKFLNDYYDEGGENWYNDDITPSGLKFDGTMPWGCKIPLGRKATRDKTPLELILTPSQCAELLDDENENKHGYHLCEVMQNITLVHGS